MLEHCIIEGDVSPIFSSIQVGSPELCDLECEVRMLQLGAMVRKVVNVGA